MDRTDVNTFIARATSIRAEAYDGKDDNGERAPKDSKGHKKRYKVRLMFKGRVIDDFYFGKMLKATGQMQFSDRNTQPAMRIILIDLQSDTETVYSREGRGIDGHGKPPSNFDPIAR